MKDLQGREYLTTEQAKEGLVVEFDQGFGCINKKVQPLQYGGGYYVQCSEGRHYIDGNLEEGYYVGIYPHEQETETNTEATGNTSSQKEQTDE